MKKHGQLRTSWQVASYALLSYPYFRLSADSHLSCVGWFAIDHIQQWKCKKYEIRFTGKTTLFRTSSKNCLKHNLSRKFSVHQNSMPLKFSQVLRGPILFALQYKKQNNFTWILLYRSFHFKTFTKWMYKIQYHFNHQTMIKSFKQNVGFTSFFPAIISSKDQSFFCSKWVSIFGTRYLYEKITI